MREFFEIFRLHSRIGFLLGLFVLIAGCVVNPITGQRQLGLVSTQRQISIGEQQYLPAQQMQGGSYSVDPDLSAYVDRVGQRVSAMSEVRLPYQFVVLNSSVPNAWALPGGKIAVNRGLLVELRNEAELAAVLGHEVAHAAIGHGALQMERGLLLQGALVAVALGAGSSEYASSVLGGAQMAAGLLNLKYGRNAEREADFYGTGYLAAAGYDPFAAVSLQETFVRLSGDQRVDWLQGLFSSHPPSVERVNNNRLLVERLKAEGAEGEFAADRFQTAMRRLKGDQRAYDAYDNARLALADRRFDESARLVAEALTEQPGEPAFHGLRGDIRLRQKRYEDAVTNYDRAIMRDDAFFSYYIGRGTALAALGRVDAARSDLNRSLGLLPTAIAYNELGKLAESQGNEAEAVRYYQAASEARGDVGRVALASMLRIDVPRHPEQYIRAASGRDDGGRWMLKVANTMPVTLADVRIELETVLTDGNRSRRTTAIDRLAAAPTQTLLIRDDRSEITTVSAVVVAARVEQ